METAWETHHQWVYAKVTILPKGALMVVMWKYIDVSLLPKGLIISKAELSWVCFVWDQNPEVKLIRKETSWNFNFCYQN